MPSPRLAIITCDVLTDEVRHFSRELPQVRRIEVVEQGLHNTPDILRERLQEIVTGIETDPEIDAIVLVYGLCSRGVEGVVARRVRLAIARAHDCITLLLGSKERYAEYVRQFPGTYWYSPGWNRCHHPPGPERFEKLRREYTEKFAPDEVDYLMELEQGWMKAYEQAAYVHLGVATTPEDVDYTKRCAQWLGWRYDEQTGDPGLLRDLLAGNWDAGRFLVLEPGQSAKLTADDSIMAACDRCPAGK